MTRTVENKEVLPSSNYRGITRSTHARLKIVQANLTLQGQEFKFHEVIDLTINMGIDEAMNYLTCEHNLHRQTVSLCGQCGLSHAETIEPPWVAYRRAKEKALQGEK